MLVGNGKMPDFWEDAWCGDTSLKRKFPELYAICWEQNLTVDRAANNGGRLSFRRWLDENKQGQLRELRDMINRVPRSDFADRPKWAWNKNSLFSVKSVYSHMFANDVDISHQEI